MADKIKQPQWHMPIPKIQTQKLTILNSLTKKKEEFVPVNGNQVTWYNCGPTVYDASHIGHARTYLTVDIIRRILEDYFGFDILLIMNITDIDDKIIVRARHSHLFEQTKRKTTSVDKSLIGLMEFAWKEYVHDYFGKDDVNFESWKLFVEKNQDRNTGDLETDAKFKMRLNLAASAHGAILSARDIFNAKNNCQAAAHDVLNKCKDVLGHYLDKLHGSSLSDPSIFRDLAAYWEHEYFKDMDSLNIKRPDVLTRVSEYVPEIINFIQKIVDNGYGYESDGSVYFDTVKFNSDPNHHYAKLEPWSVSNLALIADGEGSLSSHGTKKSSSDFALWKKSKPGEPAWPSPWSEGRPGWHIECSAMACDIAGATLDIHSGGHDLAFPHHDNEIAQTEAHYECQQWVNYFLHPGHLNVEGQKMSKSLKNFTTIQEALQEYTANQIRMLFLMNPWEKKLDFKATSLQAAISVETIIQNFLVNVKAVVQEEIANPPQFTGSHTFRQREKNLLNFFLDTQNNVHHALANNINTALAIHHLLDLINKSNVYFKDQQSDDLKPNTMVLSRVGKYITKMMKCFGLTGTGPDMGYGMAKEGSIQNSEELLMPYLRVLSTFRDQIRSFSREKKDHKDFLALCDSVRDNDLVELGVSLDDRPDGTALVKLVNRDILIKSRDEKLLREAEKTALKAAKQHEKEIKRLEQLYKGRLKPMEMFKTEEYGQWDENGVPTHDKAGGELSKSKKKTLAKEWEKQKKAYEEYQKHVESNGGDIDWSVLRQKWESEGKKWKL